MLRRLLPVVAVALLSTALALPAGASAALQRRSQAGVPAAVPQRLRADQARQDDPDGPAAWLLPFRDAGEQEPAWRSTRPSGTETTASARASRSSSTSRASRPRRSFGRSKIVPVNDLARYTKRRQPLLLLDEKTGRRQIVWGELDANGAPVASRNLIIHPAKNLVPGRRYVVVLRNLRDRAPRGLWPRPALEALRQGASKAKVEQRAKRVLDLGLHGRRGQVARPRAC